MTTDRDTVLAAHPQAYATYHDGVPFKIYADHRSYVALSASHSTEAAAWADAAAAIRERAAR